MIEQIAGDELADASLRQRISDWDQFQNARQNGKQYNAREAEQLVASSFLRMPVGSGDGEETTGAAALSG